MTMRLLLAATLAAGLTFAPAAFAEEAMNPVIAKSKTHKPAKRIRRPSARPGPPVK